MRFPRAPGASHSREWAAPTGCAKPLCQRFAQGGQAAPERIATDAVRPAHRAGRSAKVRPLREHGGQKPGVRTHHNESAAGRGLTGTVGLSLSAGTSPFITYCTPTGFTLWSALNPTPRPARARVSLLSKGLGPTMTSPDSSPGKTTTTDPLNLVPRISIATTPLESGTVTE